ncbi:hypothetical protein SPRG_21986 [Saprolegnia parasitica CBS 223.65]|uniref:Uncharacterized protein n=1 Tax=Saprolegnia parasitica (strain CBS 223.65) TaxID=695850 RepID=A0A067BP51_SAPPC|nr:hypothetical protein SPRG_21986 [Saprolegnia parasitica CBS 223.65]KDO16482.1 hypothetical protein SPRG_21986 [Saprolegnia parasitica CBS 223.65]|eukprot:XP_012212809.1 hypothetical protein SPRG_21986 [Saprolegnia parasitica CBS 223.65]
MPMLPLPNVSPRVQTTYTFASDSSCATRGSSCRALAVVLLLLLPAITHCCGALALVLLLRSFSCCARPHVRSCARALRRCRPLLRPSPSTRAAAATSAARGRFSFSCLRCFVVALPA